MLNKRAQSQLIATVLIILISLMAVTLGGAIIYKSVNQSSEKIQDQQVISNIEITKASLYEDPGLPGGGEIKVTIQNNGDTDITKLTIIVSDGLNSKSVEKNSIVLDSRTMKTYSIDFDKVVDPGVFNPLDIKTITVIPEINSKPGTSVESPITNLKESSGSIGGEVSSNEVNPSEEGGGETNLPEEGPQSTIISELPSNQNIVAYWKLDGNALDESTNNIDGTPSNVIYEDSGLKNSVKSAKFNGVSSQISLGSQDPLKFSNQAFTICAWVKNLEGEGDYGDWGRIFSADTGGDSSKGYRLFYDTSTNKWAFEIDNNGKAIPVFENNPILNKWQFICGSYDGLNEKIYVNGEFSKSNPIGPISPNYNTITFAIGMRLSGLQTPTNAFKGYIDEVIIYKIELSEGNIQEIYNKFKLTS